MTIYIVNLLPDERKAVQEIALKIYEITGLLLKDSQEYALESYNDFSKTSPDTEIINRFKEVISSSDLHVLKMALFMRSEKEKGRRINSYKQDIWQAFGVRGATISSLCNAGYFENEFVEKLKALPLDDFKKYYELAVGEEAIALFVHSGLVLNEMRASFADKLARCRRNGIPDFRVLGFGRPNVEFIKVFMETANDEFDDENFKIKQRSENDHPPSIEIDIVLQ